MIKEYHKETVYSSVTSSKTFAAGSANGLYTFYAKDNAGNQSSYYYVFYGDKKPTGVIKNTSGNTLLASYNDGAFYYTASDGTKRCIIWTDSACAGTLDGESYVNGTWISAEGSHTFVLTNDAQRSSAYGIYVCRKGYSFYSDKR